MGVFDIGIKLQISLQNTIFTKHEFE